METRAASLQLSLQKGFSLGAVSVEPARNAVLREDGDPVVLAPHETRVLLMLAERAGVVVTSAALARAIAPNAVAEQADAAVAALRIALDDSALAPRFIASLGRRGHALVGRIAHHAGRDSESPGSDVTGQF